MCIVSYALFSYFPTTCKHKSTLQTKQSETRVCFLSVVTTPQITVA